jgi:hypothetical protein
MNPDYLWFTGAIQLLTIFVIGPVLGIAIAYAAWREKPQNRTPTKYRILCVASGITALLLLAFARWINADVRTPQYFVQFTCVLLFGLSLGVCMGSFFSVLLGVWRWHNATRLAGNDQTET